jgi:heme/copper-type cytochrome/quinol oxidase subunit 3
MLFASLFSGYVMLRMGAAEWPGVGAFPWLETVLLLGASAAFGETRFRVIGTHALTLTFVIIKLFGDLTLIRQGITPSTSVVWACWFTITWVHAAHVLGGALFTGWLAGPSFRMSEENHGRWLARIEAMRRYWLFVDVVWLVIVAGFYLA